MTKHTINFVIFHFPYSSLYGGLEQQTIDLFTELKKRGHKITFCGRRNEVLFEEMRNKKIAGAIPTIAPKMAATLLSGIWALICAPFSMINFYRQLKRNFQPNQKNITFMISLNEKIFATMSAIKLGYKVVWVEHVQIGKWLYAHPFLRLYKKLSKFVTIITPSEMNARLLRKLSVRNIKVINNGIEIGPAEPKNRLRNKNIYIGASGRLNGRILPTNLFGTHSPLPSSYHDKGIDIFIRTMAELKKNLPNVFGYIAGDGPSRAIFEKLANSLKAPVKFLGLLNRRQYGKFLKKCDIFVVPSSNTDSFSLTAAEALAANIPTIISDFTGIASIVKNGAYIIPGRDPQAIKKAILKIVQNPKSADKIAEQGYKIAINKFSLKKMVDDYEELFINLF